MKMSLLAAAILVSIAGCAPKPQSAVFNKLVDTAVTVYSPSTECQSILSDPVTAKIAIDLLQGNLRYAKVYATGMARNEDIVRMIEAALSEIERFEAIRDSGEKISETYCRDKLQNLYDTLIIALKTEGALSQ